MLLVLLLGTGGTGGGTGFSGGTGVGGAGTLLFSSLFLLLLLRCFFRLIHNLCFFFLLGAFGCCFSSCACCRLVAYLQPAVLSVVPVVSLLSLPRCACAFPLSASLLLFVLVSLSVLLVAFVLIQLAFLLFFFRLRFIFCSSCFATSSCFGSTFFSGFTGASSHPASSPSESSKEMNHFTLLILSLTFIRKLGANNCS